MEQMSLWRYNYTGELTINHPDNFLDPENFLVRPHTLFIASGGRLKYNSFLKEYFIPVYPLQMFLRKKDIFKFATKSEYLVNCNLRHLTLVMPDKITFALTSGHTVEVNNNNGKTTFKIFVNEAVTA